MAWSEKEMAERMIDRYRLWFYERMDLSVEVFNDDFSYWIEKRGQSYSACKDFIWSKFNERMTRFGPYIPDRYAIDRLIELTGEMFLFRLKREKKYEPKIKKLTLLYCLLRDEFSTGQKEDNFVVEILSNACCEKCKAFDETLWWYYGEGGIAVAQPLPFHFCTREWGCNCSYNLVAARFKDQIYPNREIGNWRDAGVE